MAKESETDRKLLAWLERNGPWLMKLDPQKIQWRIGLELDHGRLLGRSVDESLLVAGSVLRQEYEDGGEGHSQQTSSQEEEEQKKMQDEQAMEHQEETAAPEAPAPEAPAPEEAPPEAPSEQRKQRKAPGSYDAANCETVAPTGTCGNCNWEWGMEDAHPVHVVPQNVAVPVEGTVEPPPPPPKAEPDPNACAPVPMSGQCPKCQWTAESGNPHPVV